MSASRFWQYFHDKLNWLPIHRPGPLAALAKGLALRMDATRDDILWLREQWHPAKCEMEAVPGFGSSRGIVRHARESAAQFRSRVVNAWTWHLLGGKVQGLPQILKFYGYDIGEIVNMRGYTPTRWAEFQLGLKTPATQAEQAALLADLDTIIWLVNEYKPARSVLFRIYTDTYNVEPLVWSQGRWSEGYWSHFSGVEYPDSDNPQGPGQVVVSFGMVHRALAEAYLKGEYLARIWLSQGQAFRIPYLDRFIWSESAWSDKPARNHGFVIGQLYSTQAAELVYESGAWNGMPWPEKPWATGLRWDRPMPEWLMPWTTISKSQLFYSDNSDKAEGGHGWGDINSCWSSPLATIAGKAPRWGDFAWSGEEPRIVCQRIDEQFRHVLPVQPDPVEPELIFSPTGAGVAHGMTFLLPYGDFPAWGRFDWSDSFPGPAAIVSTNLFATIAGKPILESGKWQPRSWPETPWGELIEFGQDCRDFEIVPRGLSRSQLVYGDNAYGALNSSYSTPQMAIADKAPRWGDFAWSDWEPGMIWQAIDRQFEAKTSISPEALEPRADGLARALSQHAIFRIRNDDRPIWSDFAWSEEFAHGAATGLNQRMAAIAGSPIRAESVWSESAWPEKPWGEIIGYGLARQNFGAVL